MTGQHSNHCGVVKGPQKGTRNRQMPDSRWSSWFIDCAAVPSSCSRRAFLRNWGRWILFVLLAGLSGHLATRRSDDCGQPPTLACNRCALESGCRMRGRRVNAGTQRDSATRA
jgi:hypothetical protein